MIPTKLVEEINGWMREKRYGNIQINFAAGKIVNVNRSESLKVEGLGFYSRASVVPAGTNPIDPV